MKNIFDRLQFVKGQYHDANGNLINDGIFLTREDAINYVIDSQFDSTWPTVVAEPIVLRYESGSASKGPNVILAIGSVGVGKPQRTNRTFFIDIQKTEEEIEALDEKIEEAIKTLALLPIDSDTIDLSTEKTADGTILSGDVKIADYRIADGKVNYSIIQVEEGKGLYAFVDMDYDPDTFVITFNVNGVTKEFQLPTDQHLIKGWYDPKEESIFFKLADGSQVRVPVTKLIEEWTVLPDGQTINDYNVSGTTVNFTPIVFAKTHVGSKETEHEGIYEWQDVLEADIRVADHISDNIIHKDRTGRYLYVKGTADNIKYKDGITVKDALDSIDTRVSTSAGNLIYKRPDGIYATAMLDYNAAENKLVYTYSDGNSAEIKSIEFKLNSVKILEDITYDPVNEVIVIRYIDAQGEYQRVEIPASDIIEEWDVNNEAHNIQLNKYRSSGQGKDILTADAKIHIGDNNILEDLNHELYVNGISDNIKYDVTGDTTVKDVLDNLSAATDNLNDKIDQEIADRTADIERIDATIGSGFTTDVHETVTYKFEQVQNQVNEEAEKLQNEIDRSVSADTVHDGRLDAIEAEIGDGFGPRNTVRDEIDAISADSSSRLSDVINEDHSINVETRNDGNNKPTIKVIKANLSEEVEDGKENIIKLNTDGLYAGVDLIYEFNEDVGTNQLIFKTTNGTKVYDLKTNSVVDKIYYDPIREAIIIEYTVNGHRMPDVVIPVGDLINEWRVEDGHPHAVQLEKVRVASGTSEQDVLKASVIITDSHDDNILVMDNGALYVSGSGITANKADIDELKDKMDAAENDIDSLERKLDQEIADRIADVNAEEIRAISAETALDAKIHDEETRAKNIENEIINSLNDEISRSTTVDTQIINDLSEEITRSKAEDSALTTNLQNEIVRAYSAETALQTSINNERTRAEGEESRIENKLDSEISRSIAKDAELQEQINYNASNIENEINRAKSAESALTSSLQEEIERARLAEQEISNGLTGETARAEAQEEYIIHLISDEALARATNDSIISGSIESEIARSTAEDERLANLLTAETAARQAKDAELEQALIDSKLTFEDSTSIDFNNPYLEDNVVKANVKLQEGDNIIKIGSGLYASVHLSYDPGTNKIKLVTSNGEDEEIQLVGASLLEDLHYDSINKQLVITYKDATGVEHTVNFGVSELFNEWGVNNPSEKSAVELTKTPSAEPGGEDKLSGRVLITDDRNGDGKPDEGSDNIIEIRNNGLYVSGSAMTKSKEIAECVENELKQVEKALFGFIVSEECGSGFTYTPIPGTTYINTAVTVNNATFILDQTIKNLSSYTENVENKVNVVSGNTECVKKEVKSVEKAIFGNEVSDCGEDFTYTPPVGTVYINSATTINNAAYILDNSINNLSSYTTSAINAINSAITDVEDDVECVDNKSSKIYELLYGEGKVMPNCGESSIYSPHTGSCIISAATSFDEADKLLSDAVCSVLHMWTSGVTPSSTSILSDDGTNRKLLVDVRVSHGNHNGMTDEELEIRSSDGAFIDTDTTEFTDTNVVRIVHLTESPDHIALPDDNPYNGVYVSNVWDCGMYYGPSDIAAKAEAEAAGYNTNYSTDENADASNFDYMNNVRQNDI